MRLGTPFESFCSLKNKTFTNSGAWEVNLKTRCMKFVRNTISSSEDVWNNGRSQFPHGCHFWSQAEPFSKPWHFHLSDASKLLLSWSCFGHTNAWYFGWMYEHISMCLRLLTYVFESSCRLASRGKTNDSLTWAKDQNACADYLRFPDIRTHL